MNALNKGYILNRYEENGYSFLYITINFHFLSHRHDNDIKIRFQSDGQNKKWYGLKIETRADNVHALKESAKIGALIDKHNLFYFSTQPQQIIEILNNAGFQEVEYHKGVGKYCEVNNWPTQDTYIAIVKNDVLSSIFADDEKQAIKIFKKQAGKALEQGDGYMEKYWISWLNNGMIIRKSSGEIKLKLISILAPGCEELKQVA